MCSTQSISWWLSGDEFTMITSATLSLKSDGGNERYKNVFRVLVYCGYEKTISERGVGISSFKFTIFIQKMLPGMCLINFIEL